MTSDNFKRAAAEEAVKLVATDMVLGLGTGSTAAHFVDLVGQKVQNGLTVRAIPTSMATDAQARKAGIDIITPDETTQIDLAVDGADEIGPGLSLIKGGGGALLREKIIAEAARKFVVIADGSKNVPQLGEFPLPVEIEQFSWALSVRRIRETLRQQGFENPSVSLRSTHENQPFISDGGNFVIDCALSRIEGPDALDDALQALPGVVETGLFLKIADQAIVADENGVRTITS